MNVSHVFDHLIPPLESIFTASMAAGMIAVDQLAGSPVVYGGNVSFEISLTSEAFALARTWFVEAVVLC